VSAAATTGASTRGRRIFVEALAARHGGTAFAAVQLATGLARTDGIADVRVITRSGSLVHRELSHEPSVECIVLPANPAAELAHRLLWQAARLPALVRRGGCDALVSMSGLLPRSPECRLICLLFNPVMYERRSVPDVLRRWGVRSTAEHAAHLLAPSRSMAQLVADDTQRECEVLPLGLDHETFRPSPATGSEVLCVADFYAHKRHDLILDAWLLLPRPRPRLRLVGDPSVDERVFRRLMQRISRVEDSERIMVEHNLPLRTLVDVYQRARVFVLPSEHESFSMPVAESMACGVPPIVRNLPSLRETGGDGARYVEGDDPTVWAAAISKLCEDDHVYELARETSVHVASRFSWAAFVEGVAARI
jgi:glycosyltransferase involved in cell wall biosynthesis